MSLRLDSGSYGLRQVSSANKTVLLMKLTDSAMRIIESYQDKGNTRSRPNIQFQGHQGIIQIPVPGGGENDVQKFSFQVSNLSQSAGVDCLQQIRSGHTARVECLGSVHQKITVNAKDDSYDMTRKRMTLAKQEEQKTSTKVIKQPGPKIGKGFKMAKNRVIDKPHLPAKDKLSPDTKAPTPPLSRLTPTLLNRSSSPLTLPNKDRSASPPVPGSGRNKTKPSISITSSANQKEASPSNATGSNAVAARPLWDRVAHLLAVRSYKYPEIMIRLLKDKAPDKTRLQEILSQVSSTRSTNGVTEYSLLRNIYQNLEPDTWPGYTDAERKAVKKKMTELSSSNENRKRPYTNASPPGASSDGTHEEEYSNPALKKQRVSHLKGRSSGGSSPMDVDRLKSRSPGTTVSAISFGTAQLPSSKMQQPPLPRKPSRSPEKTKTASRMASPSKTQDKRSLSPLKTERHSNSTNGFKNLPEEEDFMTKYTSIISDEQRDQYKRDFYAEYQEYLKHHSIVAKVSDKFAEFQRQLSEHKKGSREYKEISKEVIQEYRRMKKNDEYHREKARWEFLHRKLQHIKDLVNQFDQHKLVGSLPENDSGFSMQTKTATRVA